MTETLPAIALYAGVASVALIAAAGGYYFYKNRGSKANSGAADEAALNLPGQDTSGLTRYAAMAAKTDARGTYQIVANAMQQNRFEDRTPATTGLTPDQRRLSELAEAAITLDSPAFEATVRYLAEREKGVFQALHDLANGRSTNEYAPMQARETARPVFEAPQAAPIAAPAVTRPAPIPMPAEPLTPSVAAEAIVEPVASEPTEETHVILQPDLSHVALTETPAFELPASNPLVTEPPVVEAAASDAQLEANLFADALRAPPMTQMDWQTSEAPQSWDATEIAEPVIVEAVVTAPIVAEQVEDVWLEHAAPLLNGEPEQAPIFAMPEAQIAAELPVEFEAVAAPIEAIAPGEPLASSELPSGQEDLLVSAPVAPPQNLDLSFVTQDAAPANAPQSNLRAPNHLIPMPGRPEAAAPAPTAAPLPVAPLPVATAPVAPSRPEPGEDDGQSKFNSRLQRALTRPSPAFDPTPTHKAKVSDQEYRPFMSVQNILSWLPENGDPDLWHLMVAGLNYDLPETLAVVHWIVQQPECDRATAALALELINLEALMPYENLEECPELSRKSWQIAETICQRANAGQYMRSEYNLRSVSYVDDPADFLETIKRYAVELLARGDTVPWPLPLELLSTPFKGRAATSALYRVEDDTLYIAVQNKTAA